MFRWSKRKQRLIDESSGGSWNDGEDDGGKYYKDRRARTRRYTINRASVRLFNKRRGVASLGFRIKTCLNGNNPAPDPYVTHIAHRAFSEQQPPCFVHWRARRRQGRRARACKSGLKNQNMNFWVLLLLLALLSGLVSSGFFCACLVPFLATARCCLLGSLRCAVLGALANFCRAQALFAFLGCRIFAFAYRFLCLCL